MNILEKIDFLNIEEQLVNESGIRNIKELAKTHKTAEIYFHKDLDGVTSAIGMKNYLKQYGIKTIDAHTINYGGEEYAIPKPRNKTLAVLVDFAHGKPVMNIHTDHHDSQIGVEKNTSTSFVKTPSNAAYISQVLSPKDLFSPEDVKIISTVDSADFTSQGITPDDIMRSVYKNNTKISVSKNKKAMGFVVNKLLLAYKNKPNFLSDLVLKANPSLVSMYNIIKKLAKDNGYKPPEQLQKDNLEYINSQKLKIKNGDIKDVKTLKNGESIMIGSTIVQQGGGSMFKGYDRYTPFKNHPDADFYTIVWPMGLIQLSKNPFKSGKNPYHLGNLVMKDIMPKFKNKLNKEVSAWDIKRIFETDINKKKIKNAMGFNYSDLIALFDKSLKGLPKDGTNYKKIFIDIMNKPSRFLSNKQKNILKKVKINVWDIIMSQSGGHKDITNISGFNFLGKGYTDIMRDVQTEIAKQMKNKRLKE